VNIRQIWGLRCPIKMILMLVFPSSKPQKHQKIQRFTSILYTLQKRNLRETILLIQDSLRFRKRTLFQGVISWFSSKGHRRARKKVRIKLQCSSRSSPQCKECYSQTIILLTSPIPLETNPLMTPYPTLWSSRMWHCQTSAQNIILWTTKKWCENSTQSTKHQISLRVAPSLQLWQNGIKIKELPRWLTTLEWSQ